MAVKKSAKSKDESATPTKAGAKDNAKTTSKKSAATKPAAASPATANAPKAAKPKAAPIKLTTSQSELLKKVHGAGEPGYSVDKKIEQRSIDALLERKLIKKGAKDKASGKIPHTLSASGRKHVEQGDKGGD